MRVFTNAWSARAARVLIVVKLSLFGSVGTTDIATKRRPISAPETPALAAKNGTKLEGITGQPRSDSRDSQFFTGVQRSQEQK
ncbi:unannotated protein [freshwater metagenome]|uniref:Unannotated protein n=1 Tax=freshwater metagenome TaxID=449393 RepID=A0A6J7AL73_9ZZZZ